MDEPLRASESGDPLRAMRKRWLLCTVLALLGAAIGLATASQHVPRITAEARLAVGSQSLQAYQVAGFAVASQALAADYARFVSDSPASQSLIEKALGTRSGQVVSIDSSPIPDSDVVRVEVTATRASAAVDAAQALAQNLVTETASNVPAKRARLLRHYEALSLDVVRQQNAVDKAPKGSALNHAKAKLATLQTRQTATAIAYQQSLASNQPESNLRMIQEAAVAGDDRMTTYELYGVVGLIGGLAVGLVAANALEARRRRRGRR
jgi:uncharacterized protein involved in exopolysaccharide biosynthesis